MKYEFTCSFVYFTQYYNLFYSLQRVKMCWYVHILVLFLDFLVVPINYEYDMVTILALVPTDRFLVDLNLSHVV